MTYEEEDIFRSLGQHKLILGLVLVHLAILYPYPNSLPPWQVAASELFLLAVTAAVLNYRERPYLLVGWFWYLIAMIPMIGLVQVGNQAMADRYAYP